MLRICRTCKVEYEGDPGSTLCPACVRAQRSSTIRDRVCRGCGVTLPGGPRAWYCLDCRQERQRQHSREAHQRAKAGNTRKLGSEDICVICGDSYTVAGSRQRYCPRCAPAAYAESDRRQALEYYTAHRDPDKRRADRQRHAAELVCVVCGMAYVPKDSSKTCSPECSAQLAKQNAAKWEKAHRDARNQSQRARYHKKKEDNNSD